MRGLFYGRMRLRCNALNLQGLNDNGSLWLVLVISRNGGDFIDNRLTLDNFAEDGVFSGQPGGCRDGDEKL